MRVEYAGLSWQWQRIAEYALPEMAATMASGKYVLGPSVESFEDEFASYMTHGSGGGYSIGVANGTQAIELALAAIGIGPGDSVVAPAHTFRASIQAIVARGATPILVDCSPFTALTEAESLLHAVRNDTKAALVVHMHGSVVCLCRASEAFARLGIPIIEDASQAHGAWDHGRRVGCRSSLACFSMYPGKNLGAAGDAGLVFTQSRYLADVVRQLRNWVDPRPHSVRRLSTNSRLDEIQAVILRAKLPLLDSWNEQRRHNASIYMDELSGAVTCLEVPVHSVFHHFVVVVPDRDRLRRSLSRQGIDTAVHYPVPIADQAIGELCDSRDASVAARKLAREGLSLPIGPHLSDSDVRYVARNVREVTVRP